MAKNKVMQWVNQVKGMIQILPRDMTIVDTAKMAIHCFLKTRNDYQRALTGDKNPLEKQKEVELKATEVKSNAKRVGFNAIRDLQWPEGLFTKKIKGEQKSAWSFEGFFNKDFFPEKKAPKNEKE